LISTAAPASILFVREALVSGQAFTECWSTAHNTAEKLLLICHQEEHPRGEIPDSILYEIERLRSK